MAATVAAVCWLGLGPAVATAVADSGALVVMVREPVEVQRRGETPSRPPTVGLSLQAGDRVRTGRAGAVEVRLGDGSLIRVAEQSEIEVARADASAQANLDAAHLVLVTGTVRASVAPAAVDRGADRARGVALSTPVAVVTAGQADLVLGHDGQTTLWMLGGQAAFAATEPAGFTLDVGRRRLSTVERGGGPTTPRPVALDLRDRLLAALPFESAAVPTPGVPTPAERVEALLGALIQTTSTDRTASAWILDGRDIRLQTPGSVVFGRPNPATSPAPTAVRIRFD